MNSDYRLLSTTRNIFCCGPKEEDEPDDGMTIDQLIKSLDNILMKISTCLKSNDSIIKLLEVPVAEVEFERLN